MSFLDQLQRLVEQKQASQITLDTRIRFVLVLRMFGSFVNQRCGCFGPGLLLKPCNNGTSLRERVMVKMTKFVIFSAILL